MTTSKMMMLGFAPPELIYYAMGKVKSDLPKTLFDVGYPLDGQAEKLKELCLKFGWQYQPLENLGTAGNWNYAWRFIGRPDILIGVEPDERPTDTTWIDKTVMIMSSERAKKLAYLGMGQAHFGKMYEHLLKPKFVIEQCVLKRYTEPVGWAMGSFSGAFLEKVGVKGGAHYGNVEGMTGAAIEANGFEWALFDEINSVHMEDDAKYTRWKIDSADRRTNVSFREWLLAEHS